MATQALAIALPSKSALRIYNLLAVVWLFVAAPLWTHQLAGYLRGPWADQAFSEVLSEKYGSYVEVHNVRFEGWRSVIFDSIRVDSKEGKPLIRAHRGKLRLRRIAFLKKNALETELRLEDLYFTKEYYKDSPAAKPWGFLLNKPIRVDSLCLRMLQNGGSTQVEVTNCRSQGVEIGGGIRVEPSGAFQNDLRIRVSPWTAIRSIL